jgi:hypothetical protein
MEQLDIAIMVNLVVLDGGWGTQGRTICLQAREPGNQYVRSG